MLRRASWRLARRPSIQEIFWLRSSLAKKPLSKKASYASPPGSKGFVSKALVSMKAFHLRSPLSKPPYPKAFHLRSPCPIPFAQKSFPSAGPVKSAQFAFGRSRYLPLCAFRRSRLRRASWRLARRPSVPGNFLARRSSVQETFWLRSSLAKNLCSRRLPMQAFLVQKARSQGPCP